MRPVTSSLSFMCLTVFLFVLGPKPGQADDVRVVVPVGSDPILPCSPCTKENLNYKRFQWMKDGQKQVFSYDASTHSNNNPTGQDDQFKGRVSFFLDQLESGDASIIIRNTTTADSGEYTCDLLSTGEKYIIHLVVDVRVVVPVGSYAILPCSISTKEDLNFKRFKWMKDGQKQVFHYDAAIHSNNNPTGQDDQFKGRVSFFPDQLKSGDASIKIRNTQTADSGEYTCDLQSTGEKYIIHLVVEKPADSASPGGIVVAVQFVIVVVVAAVICIVHKCKKRHNNEKIIRGVLETLTKLLKREAGNMQDDDKVEVQSGEESVQLPFKTLSRLSKYAEVMWMDSKGRIVHVYKKGSDRPDKQDLVYRNRTKMNGNPRRTGDVSLTLKNPTEDDSGYYRCGVYSSNVVTGNTVLLTVTGSCKTSVSVQDLVYGDLVEVESGEESVQLPCETTPGLSNTIVMWMDGKGRIVHVYENGSDQPGKQDKVYRNRTKMNENPLGTGDVSLTLKNPTEDDSGQYYCYVYRGYNQLPVRSVLLTVTARVMVQDQTGDSGTTIEMKPLMVNQSV